MTDAPPLASGSLFGRYEIRRPLGAGAFGAVYEAVQQPLGKRVALKVLHATQLHNSEALRRFTTEAEATAKLRHPNIVDVIDLGAHEGVPFIAMEFLQGEALADRLAREHRLSTRAAVDLLLPVCSAVATVHEAEIVHRDLKPENIFLATVRPGKVTPKLLDFGIAKVRETANALTRTGSMIGTVYYMSPEQARESKDVDARCDQWALAVILYELVSGSVPFPGEAMIDVLTGIVSAPVPPLPADIEHRDLLEAVLRRALSKERAERFSSVRAFAAKLLGIASPAVAEEWASEFKEEAESLEADDTTIRAASPPSLRTAPPAVSRTLAQSASVTPQEVPLGLRGSRTGAGSTRSTQGTALRVAGGVAVVAIAVGAVLAASGMPRGGSRGPLPMAEVATPYVIHLDVVPPSARIEVDGALLGVGSGAHSYPRDGVEHTLRVAANGYRDRVLRFDADHRPPEQVTLESLPMVAAPAPTAAPPAPRAAPVRTAVAVRPVRAPVARPAANTTRPVAPESAGVTSTGIEIH